MLINLFPSTRKYGKKALEMPEYIKEIESANQLIEWIQNGYIPVLLWSDTEPFLYEMMYQVIDNSRKYSYRECMGVIDAITKYYFSVADFFESDAIMTFKKFLDTSVLDFQEGKKWQ